jgi:phenylacetic acid degradation operon negative regulatory protein
MRPTARSLILDLLSTLRRGRGSMPVRALVAAGELFGLGGNAVRVALTRLGAEGLVERDQRGSYRLGPRAEAVNDQIRSWRRVDEACIEWRGGWIAVQGGNAERRRQRALRFLGFRSFEAGLLLRPDNLAGGVPGVRSQLQRLGLPEDALVFRVEDLDAAHEARARALWDVDALHAAYEASLAEVAASERRPPKLSAAEAMTESFLLGGRVIRQIVFDPLLPNTIAPDAPRVRLVEAMRRYDALGRRCWARFLADFGLPHGSAPVDVRMAEAAWHLAAAEEGGVR